MDTITTDDATTVAAVTPAMCAALSAAVNAVANDIGTATAKSFTETVAHVSALWAKVAPIYSLQNERWMANPKNTKKVAYSTKQLFDFLDESGMFKLDERLSPAAVMASRHDDDATRKEYVAASTTTFVSLPGYLTFLIAKDKKERSTTSGTALTDDQKASLSAQLMGADGAGYSFDAFVPEGVPQSAEVVILLALINDANVRLANLKVALGDKGYDAIVRDFGKSKAIKAGIVKA